MIPLRYKAGLFPGLIGAVAIAATHATASNAPNEQGRCFEVHLREAIEINHERKELYSKLTQGESLWVSRGMIWMERGLLPLAWYFDRRAKFCNEFVSMADTPQFREKVPPTTEPPLLLTKIESAHLIDPIQQAYKLGGFPQVEKAVDERLRQLSAFPSYFCLTRHFLESIGRAAHLASRYDDLRKEHSWDFIRLHLFGFRTSVILDRWAAPLQEKGIPIICQDVPHIPRS